MANLCKNSLTIAILIGFFGASIISTVISEEHISRNNQFFENNLQYQSIIENTRGYINITVEEAWSFLNDTSNGFQIPIDVRSYSEWITERIDTPYPEDPRHYWIEDLKNPQKLQDFMNLYEGKEIILYCRSGSRSQTSSQILSSNGFNGTIYNMLGGIITWKSNGFPTKVGNQSPFADFTYEPLNPSTTDIVFFNSTSTDPDGTILNWTWNFDDGTYDYGEFVTQQYSNNGTYSVTLIVRDNDSLTDVETKQLVIELVFTYNLTLLIDWNLISVPVENDMMASDLGDDITGCIMVSRFDAENQTYRTYIVGGPPGFDFPIQDGFGYFVLVDETSMLTLAGHRIDSVSVPLSIDWNMIGWYHMYNTTASSLGENITGCIMVSWFDSVSQMFKTYIIGGPPGFDFVITAGMGIFILVDVESVWYGEG